MLSPTGPSGQLFITGFMEGTSAENCGLQEEDVITAVDGERITDLPAAEASHLLSGSLNSTVTVTVLRGQGSSATSHTVALVRLIKFMHRPHTMSHTHLSYQSSEKIKKEYTRTHAHTHTHRFVTCQSTLQSQQMQT